MAKSRGIPEKHRWRRDLTIPKPPKVAKPPKPAPLKAPRLRKPREKPMPPLLARMVAP